MAYAQVRIVQSARIVTARFDPRRGMRYMNGLQYHMSSTRDASLLGVVTFE